MPSIDRVFLDTAFVQGLLNSADELHGKARDLLPELQVAAMVVTTEAVLIEIANALAVLNRAAAHDFIQVCYSTSNFEVVRLTTELLHRGLADYKKYDDKTWSLTDCISFLVMEERGIVLAATRDKHFTQRGFSELLR